MSLPPKILIIDDDEDIRLIAGLFLRNAGDYSIFEASTAAEGLEQIASHSPDFIILDFLLPDAQGDELITQILKQHQCTIIVLTARTDNSLADRFIERGAALVLHKPFNPEEFVVQVKRLLDA
jgi:two-component system KDP operon response regulator KdpE